MSIKPPFNNTRLPIGRVFVLAAIAISVLGLQVGLLWITLTCGSSSPPYFRDNARIWSPRFEGILNPAAVRFKPATFMSGTVFKNELIILLGHIIRDTATKVYVEKPFEVVRVDVRTGRLTTSPAPQDVRHVISDGSSLWWLPDGGREMIPFIHEGRPVAISPGDRHTYELLECVNDRWHETERFALLPHIKLGELESSNILVQDDQIHFLFHGWWGGIYYCKGLKVGSREQAEQFADRYGVWSYSFSADQLREIGWTKFTDFDRTSHGSRIGFWLDSGLPAAFFVNESDVSDKIHDLIYCRFRADANCDTRLVASPIRWPQKHWALYNAEDPERSWIRMVASTDEQPFICSFDKHDGRLHILRWESGQLKLVAQRGSPLVRWFCIDGGMLISINVLFPMLLLGLLASFFQPRPQQGLLCRGSETAKLASVIRRGIGRMIDVSLLVSGLVMSVVLHPDFMGWWFQVVFRTRELHRSIDEFCYQPVWGSFDELRTRLLELLSGFVEVPVVWWLFSLVIVLFVVQVACQARSGRTLGKWSCGVKVVRVTLRPCGFARSLMRELVFGLESLLLLSWVPGAICMMATRNSQRIGDLLADTIVVRDP